MLRPDASIESFHSRQIGTLPEHFGVRVTGLQEGRMQMQLEIQPWMMAPNGFLHAASVVLLADTCSGYATIAHLPEGAKGVHDDRAEDQLPRHREKRRDAHRGGGRAPGAHHAGLVGDGVQRPGSQDGTVSLHADDPVVTRLQPLTDTEIRNSSSMRRTAVQ